MTSHVALERLSALVDGEVPARERERLASHLAICPECRHRLDGLRAVARGLAALERAQPTRAFDLALADLARPGEVRRRRTGLTGLDLPGADGPLALPLAAVLGLAVMLLALVAYWASAPRQEAGPAPPRILRLDPLPLAADGIELVRRGDAWRERVVDAGAAERPVRLATASEREALLKNRPELSALTRRAAVELWDGGEWLRITPPPDSGAAGSAGQEVR